MANSKNLSIQGIKDAIAQPSAAAPDAASAHVGKTPDGGVAAYQPPSEGPFKCANCEYFVAPGNCQRPEVLAEVGDADGDGLADVEAEGCCNYYSKKGSGS